MSSRVVCALQAFGCGLACSVAACAQTAAAGQAAQPGYTLHVETSIVLTDVTVTDKDGNPVQGLNRSAFQIFDNGKPQQIASFSEHTAAENPQPGPKPKAGEFNNGFLQHPPPAFNVLLLDTTNLGVPDQMHLSAQLQKFVAAMPPGDLLAVYTRASAEEPVVLLQNFTSDHALLRSAISHAIPHLPPPQFWQASDLRTLLQMVVFLKPYPGRKNLIWFSGGSSGGLFADASHFPVFFDMQPIYDELESTRIAVYPVDARGLMLNGGIGVGLQHMLMDETAQATDGRARPAKRRHNAADLCAVQTYEANV